MPNAAADDIEALVNLMVELDPEGAGVQTGQLNERLGWSRARLLESLRDAEQLGIVYRQGQKRGTRWFVG